MRASKNGEYPTFKARQHKAPAQLIASSDIRAVKNSGDGFEPALTSLDHTQSAYQPIGRLQAINLVVA